MLTANSSHLLLLFYIHFIFPIKSKYSSRLIPAERKLFLIMETGTSGQSGITIGRLIPLIVASLLSATKNGDAEPYCYDAFLINLLYCFLLQSVVLCRTVRSRQPLRCKLSQKPWSGLCLVAKAFARAPLSPKTYLIHPENPPRSQKRPI